MGVPDSKWWTTRHLDYGGRWALTGSKDTCYLFRHNVLFCLNTELRHAFICN